MPNPPKKSIDVVCVGNSHLAGFRSIMLKRLGDRSSYFFPVNWSKTNWLDFLSNNNLTRFTVKLGYEHLIDEIIVEDPNTLILMGVGIGGDNIVRAHGPLNSRKTDLRLPIKNEVDAHLINFYRHDINIRIQNALQLDRHGIYKKMLWIPAPDMCADVARYRLGETFVDSGSYLIHKEAYFIALNDVLEDFKNIKFIFHDDSFCDPTTGFTLNEYRASDNPRDIHCSPEYYTCLVDQILNDMKT